MDVGDPNKKPVFAKAVHSAHDWKKFASFAVFSVGLSIFCIALNLKALALIMLTALGATSFVAGYLYRAVLQLDRTQPRIPFLVLKEDGATEPDGGSA